MAKPLSRLKTIAENKDVHSYEDLYNYVHRYCGTTLMNAVVKYRYQMELFFDAKAVARQRVKVYRKH